MNKHEHSEDNKVESGQRFRQTLVVSAQAPEAIKPAKAALNHPASGQQHKTLFRLWQLDHLKLDAFVARGLRWLRTRVALVSKRDSHCLSRGVLHLPRELAHLRALLFIGWRVVNREQLAQRVHCHMHLLPRLRL